MLLDVLLEQHSCKLASVCLRNLLGRRERDRQQNTTIPGLCAEHTQLLLCLLDALWIWALHVLQTGQHLQLQLLLVRHAARRFLN